MTEASTVEEITAELALERQTLALYVTPEARAAVYKRRINPLLERLTDALGSQPHE